MQRKKKKSCKILFEMEIARLLLFLLSFFWISRADLELRNITFSFTGFSAQSIIGANAVPWSSPNNARFQDNSKSLATTATNKAKTETLRISNFQFGLEPNDTIIGILLEINRACAQTFGE
jgi:hypothetical protein